MTGRGNVAAVEPRNGARSPLEALAALAAEAGADEIAAEARAFAERVAGGRFYIACVGQSKRGKSTLLNGLVRERILPAGVVPVTTVPTILRFGELRGAHIRFVDGRQRDVQPGSLVDYVSEDGNPQNRKGVAAVEVFVPSDLLASGMCLVDTPGIASVFAENTLATREFLPHLDAALVVLGADPPISGDELGLVEDVARQVRHLVFVLNKADRVTASDATEARRFAERILGERLKTKVDRILEVSALEALGEGAPTRDWDRLVGELRALAREAGSDLVQIAETRGLSVLGRGLLRELREQRDALLRPLEESEKRITALETWVEEAGRSLGDLAYLLRAERERLRARLVERAERFLAAAVAPATDDLRARVRALAVAKRHLRDRSFELAQEITRKALDRWLIDLLPQAEGAYRETAERFVHLGNEFLARLASVDLDPGSLPPPLARESGFRERSHLYYTQILRLTDPPPWIRVVDLLRSRGSAREVAERVAAAYLERLLATNASRIVNDFNERILESQRRLEGDVRAAIRNARLSAKRALERARAKRAEGSEALRSEVDRIEDRLRRAGRLALAAPAAPG